MDIERKLYNSKVDSADDAGVITCVVACFGNVDRGGDIIAKGAFSKSIQTQMPKGVWHHNWDQPIAKTLEARETDEGLVIKGQFNLDTQRGRETYSDIKFGIVDQFSIGFRTVKEEFNTEEKTRTLTEVELFEWSPVLIGMNPSTRLISLKDNNTERVPFSQQLDVVLANLRGVVTRAKDISALRAKDNRTLSAERRKQLAEIRDELSALLDVPEPNEAQQVYLAYLKTASQYAGR